MSEIQPEEHERMARLEGITQVNREERERTMKVVTGGSVTEAIAGAGAVVLAILGLGGLLPGYMGAVATIAIGVALLAQGSAVAARWSRIMREIRYRGESAELGGGLGAEVFGGAAGIVLGVLALLGMLPMVLLPISLIVFGGTLLLASGVTLELGSIGAAVSERTDMATRDASFGASGLQVLAGVGGVVIGILALVGGLTPVTMTLTLIGLLVVGAAVLLSGSAVSSRLLSSRRR